MHWRGELCERRVDLGYLFAFALASSAWCLTASAQLGAAFDEPFYIKTGLASWREGSNKPLMRSGVMTLPTDVQTLPLYLWERHRGQVFDPVTELHTLLPVARAMNLVFWWLLLVYTMRLGRTLGGVWGGRLAVALVACDPNLLGHAAFATTDIAAVACLLVLVYHFRHGLGQSSTRRVFVPGLCYGLAIVAKASGMVFGLEAMAVLGLWHLGQQGALVAPVGTGPWRKFTHLWHATFHLRVDLAYIATIGFATAFIYTGSDWQPEPAMIAWAEELPPGVLRDVMVPVSQHLRIFTNAGEGLWYQVQHNARGHGTFFLGEWYNRATPAYFPVALSMKVPLPVFALLLAAFCYCRRNLWSPLAAIAVLLFALSPTCRVQIGVRFMFPVMVLGYIALASAIARSWNSPQSRGVPRWAVAGLLLALAATAGWVWPHGASYFNQLWGGPEAGARLLHDSNSDWGQGLPELKAWAEAKGESRVAVWYYGMDPAANEPPFFRAHLSYLYHDGDLARIRWVCGNARCVAVSLGCLHGNDNATAQHRLALEWVRGCTPIARTTHFVIYRLR